MCKVILFFVNECECKEKKNKCECKEYIYIYKCECKKIEKWCDFLPSIPRIPPQFVHISCLLLVPQKCLSYPILLAASDQKVQLLYFFLYSSFFALLSLFFLCSYMAALPLSPKQNISL